MAGIVFEGTRISCYLAEGSFFYEFREMFFIGIGNGNVDFPEDDAVAFDGFYFVDVDNVGAMDPNEGIRWKVFLDGFHAHEGENAAFRGVCLYADVILKALYVLDVLQFDLYQFVVAFDKYTAWGRSAGLMLLQFDEVLHFRGSLEKFCIVERFQQVIHGIGPKALDGVLLEGGSEDNFRFVADEVG